MLRKKAKGLSCVYVSIGEDKFKFLLDSGASISLIKFSKLPKIADLITNRRVTLYGVEGVIENRGLVYLDISANELEKKQRFCVIDTIVCDVDGILGLDFLREIDGVVDFKLDYIKMHESDVCIPLHCVDAVKESIPKRCEMFLEVECYEECDLVVIPGEICEGVFTAGMIERRG